MADAKLSALPQARTLGANDKLYVVASGTSSYITASDLAKQVSGDSADYYGMIIHEDVANPSDSRVEYIGKNANYTPMTMNLSTGANSLGSWGNMPTIVKNVPAMVKTDGTVDYYLDPDDYSKKVDGTTASDVANTSYDGNAFAWFEPIWMKITASGSDIEYRFAYSQLEADYFEVCPAGCGVWLPMFYGSVVGGKMRNIANTSVLGGTTGNTSTAAQYASIKANGDNYEFLGGKLVRCIVALLCMWYKSTNSDTWGRGNQDGYVNDSAQAYGTKGNPIVGGGAFYGTSDGKSANKVLHCLPLATYDAWIRDPFYLCVNGEYKVSKDYTYDPTGANYTATGILAPDQGYQKEMAVVDGFGVVPKTTGASNSTYYCDHFWINKGITAVSLWFGTCTDGRNAGAWTVLLSAAAGASHWVIGCAQILKHPR